MRKALYILGDLSDHDLVWLSRNGAMRRVANGETVIAAGAPVQDLFFVTEGRLAVRSAGGATMATLDVGDVVGEMSFVEKNPPSVSVVATSPARLLAVPRAALEDAFAQNPPFAARFYRALAVFLSDRLRTTTAAAAGEDAELELDEGLMDSLHVAGDRMLRLIDLLEGRTQA